MSETTLKNITLGTAGHIDHGKTALIKLLTGCDTDRLKAEKERGMSIELGFAPCRLADLEVGIVDVPGHENFIKTMVAGATGIDATLFVVAADDGIMPQSQEHLDILQLLGVTEGLVVLTKIDRVSPGRCDEAREEVEIFTQGTFLEDAPILSVSSTTGDGFGAFYDALCNLIKRLVPKNTEGIFRLPVERTFSVKGYGTVISGIPVSGHAAVGDEVILHPQGTHGRIKALQVYQQQSDRVVCGQCAALNVPQWDARTVQRGDVVTLPGVFNPALWYLCRLQTLPFAGIQVKNGSQLKFHTGTVEAMATLYLMEGNRLMPGQKQLIQVHLAQPIVAGPGDRFILRLHAPARTLGGGLVVEALEGKLRRSRPHVLADAWARAQAVAHPTDFVSYCLLNALDGTLSQQELKSRCKLTDSQISGIIEGLCQNGQVRVTPAQRFVHSEILRLRTRDFLAALDAYHVTEPNSPGISRDVCMQSLALRKDLLDLLLAPFLKDGQVVEQSGRLARPGHTQIQDPTLRRLFEKIEACYLQSLFRPPKLVELSSQINKNTREVEKVVRLLAEHERLVRVDHDMYFHTEAISVATQAVVEHIQKEGMLESVQFKYLVDTTRKYAIPLLDYLDKIGITRRAPGNTRYLGAAAQP